MPPDPVFKYGNLAHRAIIALTRGRVGWTAGRMPVLRLTTTGRSSGQPRSVMLTTPHQEGGSVVVIASRGGDDRDPDWYLNLMRHPDVTVTMENTGTRRMRARATEGDERDRLWREVVGNQPRYGRYQERTERPIPVVVLDPVD